MSSTITIETHIDSANGLAYGLVEAYQGDRLLHADYCELTKALSRQRWTSALVKKINSPESAPQIEMLLLQKLQQERRRTQEREEQENAAVAKEAEASAGDVEPDDFPLTDAGNGERLFARHGGHLVYVPQLKKWRGYTRRYWKDDDTGLANRLAVETVRDLKRRAVAMSASGDPRAKKLSAKIFKHATDSESDRRLRAMLDQAWKVKGASATPDKFDVDPWKFNCVTGTINLRTGELLPHNPADMITKMSPVAYDPAATAPTFEAYLDAIFGGNEKLKTFIKRMIGYCLSGCTTERALFILWGAGSNGKSTLLSILRRLLGPYANHIAAKTLLATKDDRVRNDIARLKGARAVTASESDEGRHLAEGLVKEMTGGEDKLTARFLYGEDFEYQPEFKILYATNHRPSIRGNDPAIWDRLKLIPFNVRFYDSEKAAEEAGADRSRVKDKSLIDKLSAEMPGILAWAVQGCLEWQRDGLGIPDEVRDATQGYREEMDRLSDFIAESCVVGPETRAPASELYEVYKIWAQLSGEEPMSQTKFGRQLSDRGFVAERDTNSGRMNRLGIGILKSEGGGK